MSRLMISWARKRVPPAGLERLISSIILIMRIVELKATATQCDGFSALFGRRKDDVVAAFHRRDECLTNVGIFSFGE